MLLFRSYGQFMEEIDRCKGAVHRGVIRCAELMRPTKMHPIYLLELVLTTRVDGELVACRQGFGDTMVPVHHSAPCANRQALEKATDTVKTWAKKWKLEVLPGELVDADAPFDWLK